jgi:hypothetical protein
MIDDIAKGVSGVKDLILYWKTVRKEKTALVTDAAKAVLTAATSTRAYMADVRDGVKQTDRHQEQALTGLWLDAYQKLLLLNEAELADKCLIKADCWSDHELWDNPKYSVPVDIDTIIGECRELVRQG